MDSYGYSLVDGQLSGRSMADSLTIVETISVNVTVNITLPNIGSLELKSILDQTLRSYSLSCKDLKILILTILIRRPMVKLERDGSRTLTFNHSVTWNYSRPYPCFYQNVILGRRRYHGEFGASPDKKRGMVTISGTIYCSRRNQDTLDGINELLIRDHKSTLEALDITVTSGINPGLVINGAEPPPYQHIPSAPIPQRGVEDTIDGLDTTGIDPLNQA